eukprot:189715-Amphidinium_carterae.1
MIVLRLFAAAIALLAGSPPFFRPLPVPHRAFCTVLPLKNPRQALHPPLIDETPQPCCNVAAHVAVSAGKDHPCWDVSLYVVLNVVPKQLQAAQVS